MDMMHVAKLHVFDYINNFLNRNEKYFVTFPFPYMNGKLHLGHSFTLSKVRRSSLCLHALIHCYYIFIDPQNSHVTYTLHGYTG